MKLSIKNIAALFGGIVSSLMLVGVPKAMALTDSQIIEELRPVPVFTITDESGSPLVAAPNEENGAPVAGVFISQTDAQAFLDSLRENDPQLVEGVRVVPVSLAEVYQLALQIQQDGGQDPLEFAFVPMEDQVESAIAVLEQRGQDPTQFEGVPLFMARAETEEGGYLTIQQGEEQVIPVFFKFEDLQQMLNRLSQEQPDLASEMIVQVINLENLIETFQASDNPELERLQLIPPQESVDFVRSLQPGAGQN
jgi:nickel transport protein